MLAGVKPASIDGVGTVARSRDSAEVSHSKVTRDRIVPGRPGGRVSARS